MRELMKREVGLLKMTEGCNVPLSPPANTNPEESGDSIEKLFDDADQEHAVEKSDDVLEETIAKDASESLLPNTGGKSLAALCGVVLDSSAIPNGATKPLIAASVAPVSDGGPLDSVSRPNLRTCPPHVRSLATDASVVTIAVTTTVDADVVAGLKAKDVSKYFKNVGDSTSAEGSLDTETMHRVNIPRWKLTNDSTLDDPYVCLGVEVMMRAKHNLERKGKLEDKCAEYTTLLSEKDVMIAHLNSLLSLKETELLRDKLNSKVASIKSKRDCLVAQKSSLESAFELFKERIKALHDEQAKDLGIQDGLKAGIDHGKVRRDLSVVEAYNPSTEKKYVDAMNALGAIDFSLLFELELKRYSSIVDLIDSLSLEGALAEIPRVEDMHPSSKQLMLPIHRPEYNVVFTKTSLSSSLEIVNLRVTSAAPITTLSTTFASSVVIPPSLVVSDQVLDAKPHSKDPPAVTFDKEELSTSPE
nr:hypothetical protein [Tanacetum cinerariifolium]